MPAHHLDDLALDRSRFAGLDDVVASVGVQVDPLDEGHLPISRRKVDLRLRGAVAAVGEAEGRRLVGVSEPECVSAAPLLGESPPDRGGRPPCTSPGAPRCRR